jgi:RNA polymerase sigma factor (sigma-70 family)
MESPDLDSCNKLFADHEHKALAVVNAYCKQINPTVRYLKQDILSEAMMALWVACLRFKQTPNNTFWTFAYLRVKGSITDYLRREKLQVRGDRLDSQIHFVSLNEWFDNNKEWRANQDFPGVESSSLSNTIMVDLRSTAEIKAVEMRSEIDQSMRIAGLTQTESTVLNQYYAEGCTVSEISTVTSSTQAATCKIIYSGTRKLRETGLNA